MTNDITDGCEEINIPIENRVDEEPPPKFQYTKTNIPSSSASRDEFRRKIEGCSCRPWPFLNNDQNGVCSAAQCRTDDCACVQRSYGPNFNPDGRIAIAEKFTDLPVFECNSHCSCYGSQNCQNRLVQNGIRVKLSVFRTDNGRGWGLKAEEDVREGTFICEYAGEILDEGEASRRTEDQDASGSPNYIYVLREFVEGGRASVTYVDPKLVGNVGRFVNHSCEPNLTMVPVRIDHAVPRLCLFASRDIRRLEELTFNYSGGLNPIQSSEMKETRGRSSVSDILNTEINRKLCYCQAKSCQRYLPRDPSVFPRLN